MFTLNDKAREMLLSISKQFRVLARNRVDFSKVDLPYTEAVAILLYNIATLNEPFTNWENYCKNIVLGAYQFADIINQSQDKKKGQTDLALESGDRAKLRDALVEARKVIYSVGGRWATETLPIIDAALSAPSRNCDMFATKLDAKHKWEKVCEAGLPEQGPFEDWIFALATKGGKE